MDLKPDLENESLLEDAPLPAAPRRTWARHAVSIAAASAALVVASLAAARRRASVAPIVWQGAGSGGFGPLESVQRLKDISGMGYVGEGTFIAVHDAKADENPSFQRVSMLQIPYGLVPGIQWAEVQDINWPTDRKISVGGKSAPVAGPNDMESVATIPGTDEGVGLFLLCESTNSREDTPVADRIYLAEVLVSPDPGVNIKGYTTWSTFADTTNVEATAAVKLNNGRYLFLWGERDGTTLEWADLEFEPELVIGQGFARGQGKFTLENPDHYNRPIVGLDVDEVTGEIYLVSSNDLEGATAKPLPPGIDADNGPYWSMTSTIGKVDLDTGAVTIYPMPKAVTHQDGFKVETVSRVQTLSPFQGHTFNTTAPATFIATDDENYGGTIRKLDL